MPPPDESRCAQMTFSPHIANVGSLIEATAGPITSQCGGPATSVSYGWPVPNQATGNLPGLVQAHRCPVDALRCEYRAVMFTQLGLWNGLCITGTSHDGGWSSCESYFVPVGRYLRLTGPISGLNGKSVVVHLSGAGVRETATTDSDAFWQFAVRKGTYKLSFRWHGKTVRRTVKVRGRPGSAVIVNLTA